MQFLPRALRLFQMPLMTSPKILFPILNYLFLLILVGSCSSNEPAVYMPVLEEPEAFRYLALGDSYTIGERVAEAERFPAQLVTRINEKGIKMAPPEIIAKTGWRTDNLQGAIEAAALQDTFDLVSLLIGVNDQYQGIDIAGYDEAFAALLEIAIQKVGGNNNRVFVLSIPDYAFTPFGESRPNATVISQEIDAYNAINKSITINQGIAYFDITPISRKGLDDSTLVAADGLHPSGKMYGQWIDLVLDEVIGLLE